MFVIDDDNNITITRGDTAIITVDITDDEGNPYVLSGTEYLLFTVKKLYTQTPALIKKISTDGNIQLDSSDTDTLSFGTYKFDVVLISELRGIDTFIYERDFTIAEEVHNLAEEV